MMKRIIALGLITFGATIGVILVLGLVVAHPAGPLGIAQSSLTTGGAVGSSANLPGQVAASPGAAGATGGTTTTGQSQPTTGGSTTTGGSGSTGGGQPSGGATPSPSTVATPTPTPAPPACGQANGPCSAAQVAAHNSASNCWVIYAGSYFNVTNYVAGNDPSGPHLGGNGVFNSTTCGHDITAYMNGSASVNGLQWAHDAAAYSILNSYKVGPVQ